jgi:HAMP domain-containing protein
MRGRRMSLLLWFAAGLALGALLDLAWRRVTRPVPRIEADR